MLGALVGAAVGLAVGLAAEGQPGGYIFAAVLASWSLALAWRFANARLVLNADGLVIPGWRPPRWVRVFDLAEIDRFELGEERGGTVWVQLAGGGRVRTSITKTVAGGLSAATTPDNTVRELNRVLATLKRDL